MERQYQEFYSLQSALVQFHGSFDDVRLPPKTKMFGGKGLDVLQSKLEPFQDFLVKLLQKPSLKKSDLLFTFLTSKTEFTEASSYKLFKSVPSIKLSKERGQFLQSFLALYRSSTQPPAPRPGKMISDGEEKSGESVFGDNMSQVCVSSVSTLGPSQQHQVQGVYDLMLFLAIRLCDIKEHWLRFFTSVR